MTAIPSPTTPVTGARTGTSAVEGRVPRVLLRGGSIHSPAAPSATAMFTHGAQVVWIGDDRGASTYVDQADRVVELGGRLVTPGFVDAHVHLASTGFALGSLDLSRARSMAEALDLLAAHGRTEASRAATVVFAFGWDETTWPEQRPFTAAELDRAIGPRVGYVSRVDSHSAIVSTALLDADPSIAEREGWRGDGFVARDAHHAARAVTHALWTPADREHALRTALVHAAGQGVTSVHELNAPHIAPFSDFATIQAIATETAVPEVVGYWGALFDDLGELGVGGELREPGDLAELDAAVAAAGLHGFAGDLCVDGAVGSRTACMHAPYADADTAGNLYLDRGQVAEHVVFCTERGLQAGFHVIGDRAMAETVAGFEQAAGKLGDTVIAGAGHRLEHVEMPTPEGVAALARLGVVASVQPAFDAAWGGTDELYERRLGPDRARPMNPFGSMQRAGVALAFGSDSPITPIEPWAAVRAATAHHDEDERISTSAAFHAHTRGGHRARRDHEGGVLRPGAPASYAVWDVPAGARRVDRLGRDTPALPDLHPDLPLPRCVQTVVDGVPVHSAEDIR